MRLIHILFGILSFLAFHDMLLRQIVPTNGNILSGLLFNLWHRGDLC
jgi:hypothetical protein